MEHFIRRIYLSALFLFLLFNSYSQESGSIDPYPPSFPQNKLVLINPGNYLFPVFPSITPQLNFGIEYTCNLLSFGPYMAFYQFKEAIERQLSTKYIRDNIRYNHIMFGVKACIHITNSLNSLMNININASFLDVYLFGLGGYNYVYSGFSSANLEYARANEKFRYGLGAGLRSMVTSRFGFFIEGTYSSYSYCNFGLTTAIGKMN